MAENERDHDTGTDSRDGSGSPDIVKDGTQLKDENGGAKENAGNRVSESESIEARQKSLNPKTKTSKPVINDDQKEKAIQEYIESAIQQDVVAYNGYEIRRKYPKAVAALKLYMEDKAQTPLEDDVFMGVLLYSPRTVLFGFFDSVKVFVNILGYDNKWYFTIERISQSKEDYPNRLKAEVDAFITAFSELEKQLSYKP